MDEWLHAVAGVFDSADTQRFYITVLNYQLLGGLHLSQSQLVIAASVSHNPADGFLGPYTVAPFLIARPLI